MGIVNLRDAIILSFLKDGTKTRKEIVQSLGAGNEITARSLGFLKKSGFVEKRNIKGDELYLITDNGRKSIENIYRKLSVAA